MTDCSAPIRSTVRTQSIEVKPPPTVTTRLPTQTSFWPRLTSSRNCEPGDDAVQVLAGDAELLRDLAAGGDDDGVVGVGQLLQGDVLADFGVVPDLDAEIGDQLDLFHDHVARQAPLRHARPHHAARDRVALVDGDLVALAGELAARRSDRSRRRR